MNVVRRPFQMTLPEDLWGLTFAFKRAGYRLYVVGGAVRDAILGKEPKDYDVATDATPEQVLAILREIPAWRTNEVGRAFGVVRARLHNPDETVMCREYEIATFRTDVGKGRRPESVIFSSIEEDVKRRDLTMNAVFFDAQQQEIVDYVGGIADIENGVVKAVGDPKERFDEDRLRILRALRFAARMDSQLDHETSQAILNDNSLAGVSPERIRDEFLKGFKSAKDVRHYFMMYDEFNLWDQIFPGLKVARNNVGPTRDVAVMLALVLTDNAPEDVARKLNALKYPANESSQAAFLLRFRSLGFGNAYKLRKAADSCHISAEQLKEYADQRGLPHPGLLNAFLRFKPTVNGNDVMAQGYSGAEVGKELERQETELFVKLSGGGT